MNGKSIELAQNWLKQLAMGPRPIRAFGMDFVVQL